MALLSLIRDKRAVSALEFGLIAPLLFSMAIGTAQMGRLYLAHAGLRQLLGEGARLASISPRPTDAAIKARLRRGGFGLNTANLAEPVITYCATLPTAASSAVPATCAVATTTAPIVTPIDYADITVSYTLQLDYVFWQPAATVLTETRRVFIYPAPPAAPAVPAVPALPVVPAVPTTPV